MVGGVVGVIRTVVWCGTFCSWCDTCCSAVWFVLHCSVVRSAVWCSTSEWCSVVYVVQCGVVCAVVWRGVVLGESEVW